MSFSKALRQYRIKNGLTQKQLSELLNVPLGTYTQWEQGKSLPQPVRWNDIKNLINDEDVENSWVNERMSKY